MPYSCDTAIIGAGINALAAAVHLSQHGHKVSVFEQASAAGGAVKTSELTLPGFRHDWAAMNLSLFAGSPFFKEHGDLLVEHGLEFVPVPRPFASTFPDKTWCGVSSDASETLGHISRLSTADAKAWQQLTSNFPSEAQALFALLGCEMKISAFAFFLLQTFRQKGLSGSLDLMRFLLQSPRSWLHETFENEKVRALLGAWGMHLDFSPDISGGALFPYLEGMAGQAFGMVLGKGGADTVIQAMVNAIRAKGGTVETDIGVTRILHDGKTAQGLQLSDGQTIKARQVIAGVAPSALSRLTGPVSPTYDRAMSSYAHAPGTMMIHLAMEDLPDWSAGPELKQYAYVHLAPSLDQMARTYTQAKAGLLPDEPVLVVGQPTVFDPSRARPGKHILWVQVRMAPGIINGDAKSEISATNWRDAAEPFAERALAILENYAPGTYSRIIARRIVTPQELEIDNPNLVGGDQLCGSHHLSQNFFFRPARGHADGSTPIKNLHLTGAAVWPGAGTGAGPGFMLARRLAGN